MVSVVALCLRTDVHRVVAAALRRKRAQALRCEEFACADVEHRLLLGWCERRVVECNGEYHVRTYAPVGVVLRLYVVEEVAIFVDEGLYERLAAECSHLLEVRSLCGVAKVGSHRCAELEGVVPEGVELDDVACARYDGVSAGCRVHPCYGLFLAFRVEKSVLAELQVRVAVVLDIMQYVVEQLAVLAVALFATCMFCILLHSPYAPEQNIGLVDLINLRCERLACHELVECAHGCLHYKLKVVFLLDRERKTRQRDECVACAALEPRIAGEDVSLVFLCAVVELVRCVDETVEEVVAR